MKKLLCLILVLFTLPFSTFVSAEPEYLDIAEKQKVLSDLEIIENVDEKLDKEITRRDFVISAGKLININMHDVDDDRYYRDMTSDDRAWNVANTLVKAGILTVGEDKLFRPDDIITSDEAACIIMKILGVRNIDYNLYFDIAVKYDVISGARGVKLLYSDAIELFFKALNTNTFDYTGKDGYKQGDKTLIEAMYSYRYIEGRINSVNKTSLFGSAAVGNGKIMIGQTVINNNLINPYEYLGCYAGVYYKEKDGEKELIDIFIMKNEINTMKIGADDFSAFDKSDYTVGYYDNGGDKLKKIRLDKGVTIIKNGDNDNADIVNAFSSIKNGEISFIDSDKNGLYEIAIINSYENVIVKTVDNENKKIFGKYANVIDLSDDDIPYLIVSSTGETKTIKDIQTDCVISFYNSDNLKRLVVSTNSVSGDIDLITKENDTVKVRISGVEYKIDSDYINNSVATLNVGSTVKTWIDAYGKIANLDIVNNSGGTFAWIVKTAVEDGFDNVLKLMLFTEDSKLESYSAAEKVSIDGVKCSNTDAMIKALKNANGNADGQLVLIKKNSKGEITYIDTVYKGNEENGLFVSAQESTQTFFGGQMLLGPQIRLNQSSKLFIVPQSENYRMNEKAYKLVNGNSYFSSWSSYTLTAYRNANENTVGYTDAMVMKSDLLGMNDSSPLSRISMVKSVGDIWDDDSESVKKRSYCTYGCV